MQDVPISDLNTTLLVAVHLTHSMLSNKPKDISGNITVSGNSQCLKCIQDLPTLVQNFIIATQQHSLMVYRDVCAVDMSSEQYALDTNSITASANNLESNVMVGIGDGCFGGFKGMVVVLYGNCQVVISYFGTNPEQKVFLFFTFCLCFVFVFCVVCPTSGTQKSYSVVRCCVMICSVVWWCW